METIVVTGAAGSLGQRVIGLLADSRSHYRLVGVDSVPLSGVPSGVEGRVIDLGAEAGESEDALDEVLARADCVIHLAWRSRSARHERPRPDSVNHRALARVLRLSGAGGIRHFVYVSSATVYGAWADNGVPLPEDAPLRPNPEFAFAVEKAESERLIDEWAEQHREVAVALLRPTVTVGSSGRPPYEVLAGTRAPSSPDGARLVQFLHVDDLAAAVAVVVDNSLSGVFNVAPDAGIPQATARALAGGVRAVTLPAWIATRVSALIWDLCGWGIPRQAAAYSLHPWVIAADRLRAAGWKPMYTSEEALVATDTRSHWDDLPPGRRQNYTFAATGIVVIVAGAAATGALGWYWAKARHLSRRDR